MSVQFGTWNFEGRPPAAEYIERVTATLAPYGPDGIQTYSNGGVKILYRAFHTTNESRRETQPHISRSGAVITWDGRLDNRADLISSVDDTLTASSTDVAIVGAAYEKWGTGCFAKLIGDWALSVYNPNEGSLILAKDPIGVRHLYYSLRDNQASWSTILDPLVLFAGTPFALNEEYVAGWFAMLFPASHLTPYIGIHAVPPSSSVLLGQSKHEVSRYWDFDSDKKIRHSSDSEYEEHFLTVFATAVQRRLRSDAPVLADLSGGMDSSSIVCTADRIIARGDAAPPRLDTLSWFNDFDPDMNERPYFVKVEEKRGRTGFHIDLGELNRIEIDSQRSFASDFEGNRFAATPISNSTLTPPFRQYAAHMKSHGHRVTLSGVGGEEATGGGVPTPTPELQNLLARADFFTLARQLDAWSAKMGKSRLPLLWDALRGFFFPLPASVPAKVHLTSWFVPGFVRRNRRALCAFRPRVKVFGALPSFQNHAHELDQAQRFLAYCQLHSELLREVRYPYLDRDLLEFVYAIPREQLVRVGERRSLMKRALAGIVPIDLLNRKRRAGIGLNRKREATAGWPTSAEMGPHLVSGSAGIIDPIRFSDALQRARNGEEICAPTLMRTIKLEFWLRHLSVQGLLVTRCPKQETHMLPVEDQELGSALQQKKFS